MKFEDFKSGTFKQQFQYKSFTPALINRSWTWDDPTINTLLETATKELGELNAYSYIVPNIDLFIKMHIIKEANTSSRIEGTRTEMDEALLEKEQVDPEKRDDWEEVQNYVKAMNFSLDALKKLPLSSRLLKETHAILMQGVRGENKVPGEFRKSQNWIGGSNLQNAFFIPPSHIEIDDLMSDLEKFWHNEEISVPHLIKIAISHYQFETIHPFLDGNGRIGRLLITLYLISHGFIDKPSLYLSAHLEKFKGAYYDALTAVRVSNNIMHWVKFFLTAIIETARIGKETFQSILKLRAELDDIILTFGKRAENAKKVLEYLYEKPTVEVNDIAKLLNTTHQTANKLVKEFVNSGILVEMTGYQRNRMFTFRKYLILFLDAK